jgi:hypothetical protein
MRIMDKDPGKLNKILNAFWTSMRSPALECPSSLLYRMFLLNRERPGHFIADCPVFA